MTNASLMSLGCTCQYIYYDGFSQQKVLDLLMYVMYRYLTTHFVINYVVLKSICAQPSSITDYCRMVKNKTFSNCIQ